MGEETSLLPLLIGSTALGGVIVAVVTALFNRRRVKAETTSIISQAAGGLVENLSKDNLRLRGDNAVLEAKVSELLAQEARRKRNERRMKESVEQHNEYDQQLYDMLSQQGIQAPPPRPIAWPSDNEDGAD